MYAASAPYSAYQNPVSILHPHHTLQGHHPVSTQHQHHVVAMPGMYLHSTSIIMFLSTLHHHHTLQSSSRLRSKRALVEPSMALALLRRTRRDKSVIACIGRTCKPQRQSRGVAERQEGREEKPGREGGLRRRENEVNGVGQGVVAWGWGA